MRISPRSSAVVSPPIRRKRAKRSIRMPIHQRTDSSSSYRNLAVSAAASGDVILDIGGCTSADPAILTGSSTSTAIASHSHTLIMCSSQSSADSASSAGTSASSSSGDSASQYKLMNRLSCSYCCYRLHNRSANGGRRSALIWPLLAVCAFVSLYWYGSAYMQRALFWIEAQNPWLTFAVFMCLFAVVSFPVIVGYLILIITSGYLFGCLKGLLTVVVGANLGVTIAHHSIRALQTRLPVQRLLKNETARAILRVISGPRAFKVVLLARLTPIPFGLQNTIFGVSNVPARSYHWGTLLGLLPAQLINVYIGSSLRSMHDVLHNHNTALTSYAVFAVQICIGAVLMTWVVHRARRELAEALLTEIDSDYKVIVEVQS